MGVQQQECNAAHGALVWPALSVSFHHLFPISHHPPQQQGKGIIGLAWRPVPCEAAATNGTASSEATAALEQAVGGCMRGQGCGQLQERARRLPSA